MFISNKQSLEKMLFKYFLRIIKFRFCCWKDLIVEYLMPEMSYCSLSASLPLFFVRVHICSLETDPHHSIRNLDPGSNSIGVITDNRQGSRYHKVYFQV